MQLQCNVNEEEDKHLYLSFIRINIALESVVDTEYNFRALLMRRRQVLVLVLLPNQRGVNNYKHFSAKYLATLKTKALSLTFTLFIWNIGDEIQDGSLSTQGISHVKSRRITASCRK